MKHKNKFLQTLLALVEGGMMLAIAYVLDYLCGLLPFQFPYGGSISISVLPLVYYSFRRGTKWAVGAGLVFSALQMILGWYPPPANTLWAAALCVLLDYVVAFAVVGFADLFAKLFGKHRTVGYAVGAFSVCFLRFVSSYVSGIVLYGSYAPEGMPVWLYSLLYNGGYMLPNAVLITVLSVALCIAVDPKTLRPMKREKHE